MDAASARPAEPSGSHHSDGTAMRMEASIPHRKAVPVRRLRAAGGRGPPGRGARRRARGGAARGDGRRGLPPQASPARPPAPAPNLSGFPSAQVGPAPRSTGKRFAARRARERVADPLLVVAVLGVGLAATGYLAHRLRLPPALGYLAVGVVLSPTVKSTPSLPPEVLAPAAHIAVLFVLFLIGLELDLRRLRQGLGD